MDPLTTHHYCPAHECAYPAGRRCPRCTPDWQEIATKAVGLLRRTPDRGSRVLAEYRVEVGKFLTRDDVKGIGGGNDQAASKA